MSYHVMSVKQWRPRRCFAAVSGGWSRKCLEAGAAAANVSLSRAARRAPKFSRCAAHSAQRQGRESYREGTVPLYFNRHPDQVLSLRVPLSTGVICTKAFLARTTGLDGLLCAAARLYHHSCMAPGEQQLPMPTALQLAQQVTESGLLPVLAQWCSETRMRLRSSSISTSFAEQLSSSPAASDLSTGVGLLLLHTALSNSWPHGLLASKAGAAAVDEGTQLAMVLLRHAAAHPDALAAAAGADSCGQVLRACLQLAVPLAVTAVQAAAQDGMDAFGTWFSDQYGVMCHPDIHQLLVLLLVAQLQLLHSSSAETTTTTSGGSSSAQANSSSCGSSSSSAPANSSDEGAAAARRLQLDQGLQQLLAELAFPGPALVAAAARRLQPALASRLPLASSIRAVQYMLSDLRADSYSDSEFVGEHVDNTSEGDRSSVDSLALAGCEERLQFNLPLLQLQHRLAAVLVQAACVTADGELPVATAAAEAAAAAFDTWREWADCVKDYWETVSGLVAAPHYTDGNLRWSAQHELLLLSLALADVLLQQQQRRQQQQQEVAKPAAAVAAAAAAAAVGEPAEACSATSSEGASSDSQGSSRRRALEALLLLLAETSNVVCCRFGDVRVLESTRRLVRLAAQAHAAASAGQQKAVTEAAAAAEEQQLQAAISMQRVLRNCFSARMYGAAATLGVGKLVSACVQAAARGQARQGPDAVALNSQLQPVFELLVTCSKAVAAQQQRQQQQTAPRAASGVTGVRMAGELAWAASEVIGLICEQVTAAAARAAAAAAGTGCGSQQRPPETAAAQPDGAILAVCAPWLLVMGRCVWLSGTVLAGLFQSADCAEHHLHKSLQELASQLETMLAALSSCCETSSSSSSSSSHSDGSPASLQLQHALLQLRGLVHAVRLARDLAGTAVHLTAGTAWSITMDGGGSDSPADTCATTAEAATLLAAVLAANDSSGRLAVLRDGFVGQQLPQQTTQLGLAVCGALPLRACCNNPACINLSGPTEAALVGGKSCICGGCKTARFCSRECQVQSWQQHKPVCKWLTACRQHATAASSNIIISSSSSTWWQ